MTGDVLCMKDGDMNMGYIIVRVSEDKLYFSVIRSGEYDFTMPPDMEQTFVLDSLMRAGASFGEVNGAKEMYTEFPDFFGFFAKRGFKNEGDRLYAPIDLIVKYS